MRKIFVAAVLLMAFSVPAFAGWIDQTGAACDPTSRLECVYVENSSTSSVDDGGVLTLIVDGLTALFG
jgi:hypothetical protein